MDHQFYTVAVGRQASIHDWVEDLEWSVANITCIFCFLGGQGWGLGFGGSIEQGKVTIITLCRSNIKLSMEIGTFINYVLLGF